MTTAVNIQVIFYSMYGHIYQMAMAAKEGAESVEGVKTTIFQVPELIPEEALIKSGAKIAQEKFKHIPIAKAEQMAEADAIIFGTPTRFGNMCAQMRNFLDQTGGLWAKGALINKIGSVFTSTATQHGGQETTLTSFHTTLLHHGMIIVGVPYSEPGLSYTDQICGGSPYGASTITRSDGTRQPSEIELDLVRAQGKRVAELALKLKMNHELK
jgi:NAD(P)H dehydrogenase (quinone)